MKRVRGPQRSSCHAEGMDPTAPIVRPAIAEAYRRIGGHIRRTPIMQLDDGTTLKLELTQHTGSFKARGATNRLLSEHPPKAGVVTASGGNHGAAEGGKRAPSRWSYAPSLSRADAPPPIVGTGCAGSKV